MADSIAFASKRKGRPEKTKENGDLRHEEKKQAMCSLFYILLFYFRLFLEAAIGYCVPPTDDKNKWVCVY